MMTDSWVEALRKCTADVLDRLQDFHWTGKSGTNIATGLRSYELESNTKPGVRVWLLEDGRVDED